MGLFETLVAAAQESGLLGIFVPFLLVFTLFYAVLKKAKIFEGKSGRLINAIISTAAAFYVVLASPFGPQMIAFFGSYFTFTTMFILGLLGGVMLWALVKPYGEETRLKDLVVILAVISFVGAIAYAVNLMLPALPVTLPLGTVSISAVDILILISILIFIGLFYFFVSESEETGGGGQGGQGGGQ